MPRGERYQGTNPKPYPKPNPSLTLHAEVERHQGTNPKPYPKPNPTGIERHQGTRPLAPRPQLAEAAVGEALRPA